MCLVTLQNPTSHLNKKTKQRKPCTDIFTWIVPHIEWASLLFRATTNNKLDYETRCLSIWMGYVCQKKPGGENRYFESCLQWISISLSLFVRVYKASLCIAEKLIVVPIFILFSWCIQIWRMDAEYSEQNKLTVVS